MNKIKEFFSKKFGSVRSIEIDGMVYFIGVDIAKALGYANASKAVSTHCRKPVKKDIDVSSQNGKSHKARKSQTMWCITNADIYRLIVKSDLDSTEEFES